jgi:hypothetical protein
MAGSIPEARWTWAVAFRAVLAGTALGLLSLAGPTMVLGGTARTVGDTAVLVSIVLLALVVGVWAGAPDADHQQLRVRERWLAAAALTAVGASFATFSILYEQLYPSPWWRVAALLIVIGVPVYAIGMLLPVLLAWSERWLDHDDQEHAGWGALAPLVIGILAGTLAGVLISGILLLPRWSAGSVMMMGAGLLLIPLMLPESERASPNEHLLEETVTPFGTLRVTEVLFPGERQPERRLYLNDEEESGELVRSGAPTLAYVAAAEAWLSSITPRASRFLFLGGGAYTLPRRIAERDPRAEITVVELDPEVTRLAYRYFGLREHHRIASVHGDARAFLRSGGDGEFDRIYLDVYSGREALPFSLITLEAAHELRGRLRPGGVLGLNLIGQVVGRGSLTLWSTIRTYAEAFPSLAVYTHLGRDFPDPQNLLLAGSRDPEWSPPGTAGHFEIWPQEEWPEPPGATIYRDLTSEQEQRAASAARA